MRQGGVAGWVAPLAIPGLVAPFAVPGLVIRLVFGVQLVPLDLVAMGWGRIFEEQPSSLGCRKLVAAFPSCLVGGTTVLPGGVRLICVFSGLLPSLFEVAVAIEGGASFRSFSFSSASLDALCFTSAVYSVSAEEADEVVTVVTAVSPSEAIPPGVFSLGAALGGETLEKVLTGTSETKTVDNGEVSHISPARVDSGPLTCDVAWRQGGPGEELGNHCKGCKQKPTSIKETRN